MSKPVSSERSSWHVSPFEAVDQPVHLCSLIVVIDGGFLGSQGSNVS